MEKILNFRIMNLKSLFVCLYAVNLVFSCLAYEAPATFVSEQFDPSQTYNYNRFGEIQRECRSFLSGASELSVEESRDYSIRNELSFSNGDWVQETGEAPLMPFDNRDAPKDSSDFPSPMNLVSFWIMDVDQVRGSSKMVNVTGLMNLGVIRNWTMPGMPYSKSPNFEITPGQSKLTISFEGIYFESEKNGKERLICMLGTSLLPTRHVDSTDPWDWMDNSSTSYYKPHLLEDDKMLLVLRYPSEMTLTTRAIHGEMRSLNPKSNIRYFNKINISSQLGAYLNYQFGSEKFVSKACDPYPYHDNLMDDQIKSFEGYGYCGILQGFSWGEAFDVVPNWNCNSTDEYCSKLGPFDSGREVRATDGGFNNIRLIMQDLRCEPGIKKDNSTMAKVSVIFRVILPSETKFTEAQRSGLSGMTLPAEGIWDSSNGQLCMVGCVPSLDPSIDGCNSRICIYVPISYSIRQRSIILGTISSIKNGTDGFYPLSFESIAHPRELWNRLSSANLSYRYTKIDSAGAFLDRSEPFEFGKIIKKSLLSYPTKEEGEELVSLSLLTEDLTLQATAFPVSLSRTHFGKTLIQLEILSIGSFFGGYWSQDNSSVEYTKPQDTSQPKPDPTEKQLLLNVSAEITLTDAPYNISRLFLEGLYDPIVGKMYLIGCRDVRASWKILFESSDLEDGLDCLIEVKVEYPPTTARWLVNPSAKISISSRRNEDDPLSFTPITFLTVPILYRRQREDIISRRGVEGILRILTLSVVIACILGQLFYIRDNVEAVPYISLVMLGVQALGYSLPLITGAEALFARLASESYEAPSYNLEKNQLFQAIDYTVKLLVLVSFLLTLRLCQKVWKSRIRLLTRTPLEPGRVPSDKRVLLTSLAIHTVGFLIVLIVHTLQASQRPIHSDTYVDSRGNTHKQREWATELTEYVGLIQDFFLFPQIIGNIFWQISCKPLRKVYYIGVTVVRLLPHLYDYMRAPVFNPYFSEQYEFVNPSLDFYSTFGDVAIPVTATVLALIVYIQQRWNYQKLSQTLKSGQSKLLPLGSRVYERLPSLSFEAELVSGVNGTNTNGNLQSDEE